MYIVHNLPHPVNFFFQKFYILRVYQLIWGVGEIWVESIESGMKNLPFDVQFFISPPQKKKKKKKNLHRTVA